jgi:5-methylcytosine-specific restriction enzyme subunit McrC
MSYALRQLIIDVTLDYKPMHALCRFFLENSGPTHKIGERSMLPFLLDMSRLYELFVAEWLEKHMSYLPSRYSIRTFENFRLGYGKRIGFEIDLVLYKDNEAYCVLDMKYKAQGDIEKPDFNQIVTYAVAKECKGAILIYPKPLKDPFNERLPGNIRVRSMTFSLDGNLEKSGESFIKELISIMPD